MSKPVAEILVTPPMRDYRRQRITLNEHYPHHIHVSYKNAFVPWQIPWAFRGLHPVNLNRIRAAGGVQVRAVYLPYWPNDWLGRLGKFLFGWMNL